MIKLDEDKLIASAIAVALPENTIRAIAEKAISARVQLVGVREACSLLNMGEKAVRALGLPRVMMGDAKVRYRISDIETKIKEATE